MDFALRANEGKKSFLKLVNSGKLGKIESTLQADSRLHSENDTESKIPSIYKPEQRNGYELIGSGIKVVPNLQTIDPIRAEISA